MHTSEITAAKKRNLAIMPARAVECDCGGSGMYFAGGAVVNDVYTGRVGECYRCAGKGWQTPRDRRRNAYYDRHVRVIRM